MSAAAGLAPLARRSAHAVLGLAAGPATSAWAPYSRLFALDDGRPWVIAHEMRALAATARRLGIRTPPAWLARHAPRQALFFGSHFDLLARPWIAPTHRLGTAYFHGRPGSGEPAFDEAFAAFRRMHHRLAAVQVSHRAAREWLLESGIAPVRVHLVPIGIELPWFPAVTPASRAAARAALRLPADAVVVGSFQKDGAGWGDGMEPKRVKGPDVLVASLRALHARVPGLVVLLSGPARGWVRAALAAAGVPHVHRRVARYADMARLYHALDAYLVASRQEGGPKAVLEAMACGVPLVSTRVGMASDLVVHGANGWLADVEDAEALAHWTHVAATDDAARARVTAGGRATAEAHAYERLDPAWAALLAGMVDA